MILFPIESEWIELHKLLKVAGIYPSGGMAKQMITAGLVRVDGEQETRKSKKIYCGQTVETEGLIVKAVKK